MNNWFNPAEQVVWKRKVSITPTDFDEALDVVMHMREADRREVLALRQPYDFPQNIALEMSAPAPEGQSHLSYCAKSNGMPVAVGGGYEYRPTMWLVYMMATDAWPEVALSVHRFVRTALFPAMWREGANRIECRSIEGHTVAHRWLERLGAVHETDLIDCGPNRETFRLYAWRRSDAERGDDV